MTNYTKVENFTLEDAYSVCEPTHFKWYSKNLTVLYDGYTSEGVRVHIVEGKEFIEPVMISNAIVISTGEYLCL